MVDTPLKSGCFGLNDDDALEVKKLRFTVRTLPRGKAYPSGSTFYIWWIRSTSINIIQPTEFSGGCGVSGNAVHQSAQICAD